MIRLRWICCTSLKMGLHNFKENCDESALTLHLNFLFIVTFPILLFVKDFNSTDDGINSEIPQLLI